MFTICAAAGRRALFQQVALLAVCLAPLSANAEVQLYVEQNAGLAWIKYQCTAGEVVRAFSLDVSVDQGEIVGISDFFVGESTAVLQGYGIFPSSFRDHISIGSGTNINWETSDYTPVAAVEDDLADTLPGLGSSGVTLEFGALWDPAVPESIPPPNGTLCALQISQGATVSVSANLSRGGIVASNPELILASVFNDAFVQPPEITAYFEVWGIFVITFLGGDLERANSLDGPWTGTGSTNGAYAEPLVASTNAFYRVRSP